MLGLLGFAALAACHQASSDPSQPIPAANLIAEFETSSVTTRSKYDGKEISVRGYAESAPVMPGNKDQGSVTLRAKEFKVPRSVVCWFSREQAGEFSKIKGEQHVTVKGVFVGEGGAELRFCKLIEIESD